MCKRLQIRRLEDIVNKVFPRLFDQRELLSSKAYELTHFREAVEIKVKREHLTDVGHERMLKCGQAISAIKSSNMDMDNVPYTFPVGIPDLNGYEQWIVGFCDAESTFGLKLPKSGHVTAYFSLGQHVLNVHLLHGLQSYFNCGHVDSKKEGRYYEYIVSKQDDLRNAAKKHWCCQQ